MANTKKRDAYWRHRGSNAGPLDLQSNALPTELFRLLDTPHNVLIDSMDTKQ